MEFFVGLFNDPEAVAALWVMGFFIGALGAIVDNKSLTTLGVAMFFSMMVVMGNI